MAEDYWKVIFDNEASDGSISEPYDSAKVFDYLDCAFNTWANLKDRPVCFWFR